MEEKERVKKYRQSFIGSLKSQKGITFEKWKVSDDYILAYEKWKNEGFNKLERPIIVDDQYISTTKKRMATPKKGMAVDEFDLNGDFVKRWPYITKIDINIVKVKWSAKFERPVNGRMFKIVEG